MKTIKGTEPGSVFNVIAEGGQVCLGIRFWVNGTLKDRTVVGFRVRVASGDTPVVSVAAICEALFPDFKWDKASASHCSVSGMVTIPVALKEVGEFAAFLAADNIFTTLFDSLKTAFPAFEFVPIVEYHDYLSSFFDEVLGSIPPAVVEEKQTAVVLSFSNIHKKFIDGVEVASGVQDKSTGNHPNEDDSGNAGDAAGSVHSDPAASVGL